jgi:hypothetical protein
MAIMAAVSVMDLGLIRMRTPSGSDCLQSLTCAIISSNPNMFKRWLFKSADITFLPAGSLNAAGSGGQANQFRAGEVQRLSQCTLSPTDFLPQFLKSFPPAETCEEKEDQCDPHGLVYIHQAMIASQSFYRYRTSGNDHDQRLGRNDDCSTNQQNAHDGG